MKTRNGFVSNSSSSSFILSRQFVTDEQLELLKNHSEVATKNGWVKPEHKSWEEWEDERDAEAIACGYADPWEITITSIEVEGSTFMDNFAMKVFMRAIGIDPKKAKWDSNNGMNWD